MNINKKCRCNKNHLFRNENELPYVELSCTFLWNITGTGTHLQIRIKLQQSIYFHIFLREEGL